MKAHEKYIKRCFGYTVAGSSEGLSETERALTALGTEKLTKLDFIDPALATPFVLQGPFSHVPCQLVCLGREGGKSGVLFTCSRGYGKDMVDGLMHAGHEFGLRPAGENRFS